ncbi:MAG: lysophospholipase [Deltaproteobacteria bacterium]|nr:lysophospholipase [Deltaproteobacteria bacterium]
MTHPSLRRIETYFENPSGTRLFQRSWCANDAKRLVVIVHGIAEHSGRYETLGTWLAEQGAAVYAYDQRGHGKTRGQRAHVNSFGELVDDLEAFIQRTQQAHPGLPTTLVGVSMGGLVIATLLETRNVPVASAVLVGAALQVGPSFSRMRIAVGKLLRSMFPRMLMALGNDTRDVSSDPDEVRCFDEDPLVQTHVTTSLGVEVISAMQRIGKQGRCISTPLLLLHGEEDRYCPVSGSRRYFERQSNPNNKLQVYPGLRHALYHEVSRDEIFRETQVWIVAQEEN